MKLRTVQIREFKSIWDSNSFDVDRVTCLVGKNEAGKTAILQALYRLNPIVEGDGNFDVTHDYPRSDVEDYRQDVESGRRDQATVVEATFELESPEIEAVTANFGENVLETLTVTLSKGYEKSGNGNCIQTVSVPVVEAAVVRNLIENFSLPETVKVNVLGIATLAELAKYLVETGQKKEQEFNAAKAKANELEDGADKADALEKSKALAESEQEKALRSRVTELQKQKDLGKYIWDTILSRHFPKFLYFGEYHQMSGRENIQVLTKRQVDKSLKPSDQPLLGLIELARLDLTELLHPSSTQELKNKLQGASNHLSKRILKYWSQNKHLRMNFDVRPGVSGDPEGMQNGTNIWGEVYDEKHLVSTGLGTRSAGFVWFFSFLAWYSAGRKKDEPLILLLDEPGLSLHGKAQDDLLRYFEAEIVTNPNHQLIYTTHSPFMVDSHHFERVRIVQDRSIDSDEELPLEERGTKVFTDVLKASRDSLFPLQGALGYEIYQTLFIGPNCLIVEGVSDLFYLQNVSGVLEAKGRTGLDGRWTITPVGGSGKIPTFAALLGSQKNLNIATLIDFQKDDSQMIENLYKQRLLKKSHVLTFATFAGKAEADIEDLFEEDFYLALVNGEYSGSLQASLTILDISGPADRILVRIQSFLEKKPMNNARFNHYRPARYFSENVSKLTIPDATLDRFEQAFKAVNGLL